MSQNRLPHILVTVGLKSQSSVFEAKPPYLEALWQAGSLPLLACAGELPKAHLEAMVQRAEGVVLTGGQDVHPRLFGEEPLEGIAEVDPVRDGFELEMARLAIQHGIPVLGICRGIQVLNVAFGGTLHQDIVRLQRNPPILHRQTAPTTHDWHQVRVQPDSLLATILADEIHNGILRVNSIHHQAIHQVAQGWRVSATAVDGTIEAIEHPDYPFALGVQWHPELLTAHSPIFTNFVKACQK